MSWPQRVKINGFLIAYFIIPRQARQLQIYNFSVSGENLVSIATDDPVTLPVTITFDNG